MTLRGRHQILPPHPEARGIEIGIAAAVGFTELTGIVLGFEAFTAFAFATSAAVSIGTAAVINLGASALMQQSSRQNALTGGQGVSINDQGLRVPIRQPIPPQRLIIGNVVASGALFFQRSDPPYIWIGYEIASHKCGDLQQLILNGIEVPLEDPGTGIFRPTAAPFYDGTTRYIEVSYRDGDDNQEIDPIIARDFPDMPTSFRQRGHATVVIKANYGSTDDIHKTIYGSEGNFNPLFRFQGALVPDPRVPNFVPEDETTWTAGSSNASLGYMRYLLHRWPNMRLVLPSDINWEKVALAADIDDRWCGKSDGSMERNHTADGVIFSTDDPTEVSKRFFSAFDGILVKASGLYFPVPGCPRDPVATIHQDMIAGGFEMQTEAADRDLINIVKTEMVAPDRENNTVVGPVLRRDDLIAQDGRELETTLSLPYTVGDARAQRLANRKLIETRNARSLSMLLNIEAADRKRFTAGNIVRVDLRDFPKVNGVYQIRRVSRDLSMAKVQVEMIAYSNDRFAWYAPSDQQPFVLDEEVLAAEAA